MQAGMRQKQIGPQRVAIRRVHEGLLTFHPRIPPTPKWQYYAETTSHNQHNCHHLTRCGMMASTPELVGLFFFETSKYSLILLGSKIEVSHGRGKRRAAVKHAVHVSSKSSSKPQPQLKQGGGHITPTHQSAGTPHIPNIPCIYLHPCMEEPPLMKRNPPRPTRTCSRNKHTHACSNQKEGSSTFNSAILLQTKRAGNTAHWGLPNKNTQEIRTRK